MINYLIAAFIVAYAVLVGYTILIYFNTDTKEVPARKSKGYPIYTHGRIWFNVLWIAVAVALGSIIAKWIGEPLGGM